jgi:hypothetical protein
MGETLGSAPSGLPLAGEPLGQVSQGLPGLVLSALVFDPSLTWPSHLQAFSRLVLASLLLLPMGPGPS